MFESIEPPAADEVPPADAAAPPLTLPETPGTALMPGMLPGAERPPYCPDCTFVPCVLPVFCDAVVDWFVVALEFIRVLLLLPRTLAPDCTPVIALGFTYCSGLVWDAWLAPVRLRELPRFAPDVVLPTFMPCVLFVFCDALVDWLVVALEFIRVLLPLPLTSTFDCTPVAALGLTD
jgi:hypothetical protein